MEDQNNGPMSTGDARDDGMTPRNMDDGKVPLARVLVIGEDIPVDRKYKIMAHNPCSMKVHTEMDAMLFLAHDRALPATLRAYWQECHHLGAGQEHLDSIQGLIARVDLFQEVQGSKVPDTDTTCEISRCLGSMGPY